MQTAIARLRIWLKEKAAVVAQSYFHGSGAVVPSMAPALCKVLLPYRLRAQCPVVHQKDLPDLKQAPPRPKRSRSAGATPTSSSPPTASTPAAVPTAHRPPGGV
eukprot:8614393-Alexandrium_andersonii.AAC.1